MHSREFYLRDHNYTIGDTIYYVVRGDAVYSIKKTRIVGTEKRQSGFRFGSNPVINYIVYRTEDGRLISQTEFRTNKDEIAPSCVFRTKDEAVQFIIYSLHCEINSQKCLLLDAQQRMAQAERVLKLFEKYGK